MKTVTQFDLPWSTIIRLFIAVGAGFFLFQIRDILTLLFIVAVIVAALNPLVDSWTRYLPRWLAVSLLFLMLLLLLAGIVTLLLPPFITEGQALISQIVEAITFYLPTLKDQLTSLTDLPDFSQSFSRLGRQLYSTTIGAFGGIIAVVTTVVLTFYFLLEQHRARQYLSTYLPLAHNEALLDILKKISEKMGAWVRGQLMLAVIVGLVTFVALSIMQLIFGLPYIITLAVWAGVTEIIPYIGPILGAIPAVLVALNVSPLVALIVLAIYLVIQQIESHVLVPKVMQKAVGLSPVTIIIALLIGGKLAGFIGIVLAVPVAAAISVLLQEWPRFKKVLGK